MITLITGKGEKIFSIMAPILSALINGNPWQFSSVRLDLCIRNFPLSPALSHKGRGNLEFPSLRWEGLGEGAKM
jgi:hypothetical protein